MSRRPDLRVTAAALFAVLAVVAGCGASTDEAGPVSRASQGMSRTTASPQRETAQKGERSAQAKAGTGKGEEKQSRGKDEKTATDIRSDHDEMGQPPPGSSEQQPATAVGRIGELVRGSGTGSARSGGHEIGARQALEVIDELKQRAEERNQTGSPSPVEESLEDVLGGSKK